MEIKNYGMERRLEIWPSLVLPTKSNILVIYYYFIYKMWIILLCKRPFKHDKQHNTTIISVYVWLCEYSCTYHIIIKCGFYFDKIQYYYYIRLRDVFNIIYYNNAVLYRFSGNRLRYKRTTIPTSYCGYRLENASKTSNGCRCGVGGLRWVPMTQKT